MLTKYSQLNVNVRAQVAQIVTAFDGGDVEEITDVWDQLPEWA